MNALGDHWFAEDIWQIFSLRAMLSRAESMGVKRGVAAILVIKKGEVMQNTRFAVVDNTFCRDSRGDGDAGTNYFAVVNAKIAVMMRTGVDSGSIERTELRFGESEYRGGLVRAEGDYTIYVAFSGATEDEDVEIAKVGMLMMMADKSA